MTIQEFLQGVIIALVVTFFLAIACAVWVFFVCLALSVSFVITLVSGGIEVLVYIHQILQLRGRK